MKKKAYNFKDRVKPHGPQISAQSVMSVKQVKPVKPVKSRALGQPPKKSCKNCLKGNRVGLTNDVLCSEKGIVSSDYCCSAHRFFNFDYFKKADFFHCSDCEFFVFHPHESIRAYGVCDMFSVRKCDGSTRKACSKFVRRTEHIA